MIKALQSKYSPGRPKGPWFKWKRDPKFLDGVMMYAQRGHGCRSSFIPTIPLEYGEEMNWCQ